MRGSLWIAVLLAGLAGGCALGREATLQRLRTDNPRVQTEAIADVVRDNDRSMTGELIDLLESQDEGVRFMAAAGLRRLTGKDLGFQRADAEKRKAIVAEYRAWWAQEGGGKAEQKPVPSQK